MILVLLSALLLLVPMVLSVYKSQQRILALFFNLPAKVIHALHKEAIAKQSRLQAQLDDQEEEPLEGMEGDEGEPLIQVCSLWFVDSKPTISSLRWYNIEIGHPRNIKESAQERPSSPKSRSSKGSSSAPVS